MLRGDDTHAHTARLQCRCSTSVTASVGTRAFRRAKHSQMEHIQVVMWRTWILHQATGGGGYDVSTYSHYYTTRGIYVGLKHIAKWDDIIRALILIQSTLRAMCTNQNKFQTLLLLCRRWIITQCGAQRGAQYVFGTVGLPCTALSILILLLHCVVCICKYVQYYVQQYFILK